MDRLSVHDLFYFLKHCSLRVSLLIETTRMYINMDFKKCFRPWELSNAASISVQYVQVVLNDTCTLRGYEMEQIPRIGGS